MGLKFWSSQYLDFSQKTFRYVFVKSLVLFYEASYQKYLNNLKEMGFNIVYYSIVFDLNLQCKLKSCPGIYTHPVNKDLKYRIALIY